MDIIRVKLFMLLFLTVCFCGESNSTQNINNSVRNESGKSNENSCILADSSFINGKDIALRNRLGTSYLLNISYDSAKKNIMLKGTLGGSILDSAIISKVQEFNFGSVESQERKNSRITVIYDTTDSPKRKSANEQKQDDSKDYSNYIVIIRLLTN